MEQASNGAASNGASNGAAGNGAGNGAGTIGKAYSRLNVRSAQKGGGGGHRLYGHTSNTHTQPYLIYSTGGTQVDVGFRV